MGIFYIGHRHSSIAHSIVNYSIHRHSDRILGQDFLRRHSKCDGTKIHLLI